MILKTLFSIALFFTGGHVIDTKLGLQHYSDKDYEKIFITYFIYVTSLLEL